MLGARRKTRGAEHGTRGAKCGEQDAGARGARSRRGARRLCSFLKNVPIIVEPGHRIKCVAALVKQTAREDSEFNNDGKQIIVAVWSSFACPIPYDRRCQFVGY